MAVTCLGTFHVRVDGASVAQWRAGKARALFQYLALHRGQPASREALIAALWPDPEALAAGTSLKVAVHALRRALPPGLAVLAHEAGYQLAARSVWVDVEAFELLVRRGEHLDRAGETAAALAVYAQAADLYGGDFLPDAWEDWVVFRREGLKDQLLCVLARLADASLAAGDYHDCIRRSRQILEHDRCREDAFRVLMLCHARLGQPGRVRRWFELCVRVLRSSLDADPDPATVRLYESVLQQPRSP